MPLQKKKSKYNIFFKAVPFQSLLEPIKEEEENQPKEAFEDTKKVTIRPFPKSFIPILEPIFSQEEENQAQEVFQDTKSSVTVHSPKFFAKILEPTAVVNNDKKDENGSFFHP